MVVSIQRVMVIHILDILDGLGYPDFRKPPYIYMILYMIICIYIIIYILYLSIKKKKKRSDLIPRTRLEDSRLIRRRSARKPTELERWIASRTKETMMQSWLHKGSRKHGDFMGFHHHLWRFWRMFMTFWTFMRLSWKCLRMFEGNQWYFDYLWIIWRDLIDIEANLWRVLSDVN